MDKTKLYPEAPLTANQWSELEKLVIETARRQLVGRRFIDLYGPLGEGVQSVANDIYMNPEQGDMSFHGKELSLSEPTRRVHLTIPLLYKDFILYWRDIEQAKQLGSPIDFSAAANAAQQCALLEDDLIFNGSTEFDVPGIMNVKGKIAHIRSDWMKSGNAFTDVVEARNKLLQLGHTGPYALVLSPELYALIHRVHEGTHVLEIEHIRELMTAGIYQTPVIKGKRGVVIDTGRQNIDLAVAADMQTAFLDTENMNYLFRVYESVVLRIKRPSAICTLEDPNESA
ncbi:family 1 encapsulin nanocompartment shell protein [Geobacillus stearothermophilus]|uniref:family 1 encapsulin nanocompartment shell protein n=1 Tax=Geobacillus stearothermophilus TaxID=1422 RepID=UPI002E205B4B|nr:family 1 encapsulin nanocompartment shell protein [Geobacillus stearothermophilus]MED4979922.1 family 1 encapsulin nanocompartment shell protein [Geobacillus stearothermophilus]